MNDENKSKEQPSNPLCMNTAPSDTPPCNWPVNFNGPYIELLMTINPKDYFQSEYLNTPAPNHYSKAQLIEMYDQGLIAVKDSFMKAIKGSAKIPEGSWLFIHDEKTKRDKDKYSDKKPT